MENIGQTVKRVWGYDTLLPLEEQDIPPYLIFSDVSLREMARERPTTEDGFLQIKGVGLRKLQELGPRFLACLRQYGLSDE